MNRVLKFVIEAILNDGKNTRIENTETIHMSNQWAYRGIWVNFIAAQSRIQCKAFKCVLGVHVMMKISEINRWNIKAKCIFISLFILVQSSPLCINALSLPWFFWYGVLFLYLISFRSFRLRFRCCMRTLELCTS